MKRVVKGVIMELNQSSAIMMTGDGEFLKVRKPLSGVSIGDETSSTVINENRISTIRYAAIAASIILLLMPFIYFRQAMATVAYINVDINPSLEIGINKQNKVNDIIPLNADAEVLLDNMSLEGLDIDRALQEVIEGAKKKGFISDDKDNNIEISLIKIKDSRVTITEERLMESAQNTALKMDVNTKIRVQQASMEERHNAMNQNMSTNKYMNKVQKAREVQEVDVKKSNSLNNGKGNNNSDNSNNGNSNNDNGRNKDSDNGNGSSMTDGNNGSGPANNDSGNNKNRSQYKGPQKNETDSQSLGTGAKRGDNAGSQPAKKPFNRTKY